MFLQQYEVLITEYPPVDKNDEALFFIRLRLHKSRQMETDSEARNEFGLVSVEPIRGVVPVIEKGWNGFCRDLQVKTRKIPENVLILKAVDWQKKFYVNHSVDLGARGSDYVDEYFYWNEGRNKDTQFD